TVALRYHRPPRSCPPVIHGPVTETGRTVVTREVGERMSFRLLVLASLVALLPATALADAIEFQIVPKVLAGSRERPRITIRANEPVGGVEIVLAREGGK